MSGPSLLLVLLALKVCSKGYKRAREENDPKSQVERINGCREFGRCLAVCSCVCYLVVRLDQSLMGRSDGFMIVRLFDPSNGAPCIPYYRQRKSTGYSRGKKKNERENKSFRIVGSFSSFMRVPPTL